MSFRKANTRTYCPGVRVGNWLEDIALEEDVIKDYLDKRERGELMHQKNKIVSDHVDVEVVLSISRDGYIHFGDAVMVINPQSDQDKRCTHSLCFTYSQDASYHPMDSICAETLDAVGSTVALKPTTRSAFIIRSCDGSHDGEPLRYNQPFYLSTADGQKFLSSDRATFTLASPKTRHNKIWFGKNVNHLSEWRIVPFDPQFRMEMEYSPVHANTKILFNHVKTNQNLCIEKFLLNTYFGRERELSCWTECDSHRAEIDTNHWMLIVSAPGSDIRDVKAPEVDENVCQPVPDKDCISTP